MGSEIKYQISYLLIPYLGYARKGVSVQDSDCPCNHGPSSERILYNSHIPMIPTDRFRFFKCPILSAPFLQHETIEIVTS